MVDGTTVLLVPRDALRYETDHGVAEGARIYGGTPAKVG
jgi:hypothetical protein